MRILSDWKMGDVDGVNTPAGVLIRHSLNPDLQLRLVYIYFDHLNLITTTGQEAWVRFWRQGIEVMKLPAALVPRINVRLGVAFYNAAWVEHKGTVAGAMYWNNTDGTNADYNIAPFPVTVEADEVTLEQGIASTTTRCLLAVLSLDRPKA